MKVLFAVNDESTSEAIVKKYQKQYKEIISYKNVYYFNAILKELQKNKSYDRVVISEDLEEFTSSSYEQKDKFIFNRLDNISDEAVSEDGTDIPIILICSERRNKLEDILVKLFGIGIYNAILGDDRTFEEVCKLINKPRSKKEAKLYYKIDTEDVNYEKGNESDVREEEMQNILMHFRRLGKNEGRYVESFNNIVTQYNDAQLRVIIAMLPHSVKVVLETYSPEYQRIMNIKKKAPSREPMGVEDENEEMATKRNVRDGKFLNVDSKDIMGHPVVVPTTMEKNLVKKVTPKKSVEDVDYEEEDEEEEAIQQPKKRGRPRKNPESTDEDTKPKKRGRPKKNQEEEAVVNMLPGFDEGEEKDDYINESYDSKEEENVSYYKNNYDYDEEEDNQKLDLYKEQTANQSMEQYDNIFEEGEFESLLSQEKKVITFVGTSKNGTSFIVNNMAQILSEIGINTAILDATKNKNAYYIYTNNDEDLRKTAIMSIKNLTQGIAKGIEIKNNLTVYTDIPSQYNIINNSRPILDTLIRNHSVILIDCDFDTPVEYFEKSQEIYLIQSMDVLTIQPLTEFLRELKVKNVLEESKLKIILNKMLKLKKIDNRSIIGGMSKYNDPEMSFMTELFDRSTVKEVAQIPFDEDVYIKYLQDIANCEIEVSKYPKEFKARLNSLAGVIYPLLTGSSGNRRGKRDNRRDDNGRYTDSFSSDMNKTLNNMRNKF